MPGRRARDGDRSQLVVVRLTPEELAAWKAHVEKVGGYLSGLVREAVAEHLAFTGRNQRCRHY